MATKKNVALTIERKCPKCGTVTTYSIINIKAIRNAEKNGEEIPAKIYRCNVCGHKFMK